MPILLIRHGNTNYDEKVDALLDPPLNPEGVERIKRTAKFIASQDFKISRVVSSPLQRALKAAFMISLGKHLTTNNAALPWNLGDLMGRSNSQVDSRVLYLQTYPTIVAPHGESYQTFYDRWTRFLETLMAFAQAKPDEHLVVVTHSRNIDSLQSKIGGNRVGQVKPLTPEGSVTLLAQNGVDNWTYKLIWEGK